MASRETKTRFYQREMPEVGDLVMCQITKVTDTSAYVKLVEFNDMEGMIPFTELSRRRIRSIGRHAKVGNFEVASVIRMDRSKCYIDLSKKQVTSDEKLLCNDRYQRAKTVTGILRQVAQDTKKPISEIMKTVAWPLYEKHGHAYEPLKQAVHSPDAVLGPLNLDADVMSKLMVIISHKLKAQILRFRTDVHVTCHRGGIDAIKEVLLAGQAVGDAEPQLPLSVTISAPPIYVVRCNTDNKDLGVKKLWESIQKMKDVMKNKHGVVDVSVPPYVLGDDGDEKPAEEAGALAQSSSDSDDEAA